MKSKNKIATFGLIAVAATASVVGINQLVTKASIAPIAGDVDYTIAFNSSTKFEDGAGTHEMTSGGGGSAITFDYSGFSAYKDGWNTIATNGWIRNKKTVPSDINNGRITDLKTLVLNTNNDQSAQIRVYFAKNCGAQETDVHYSKYYSRLYNIGTGVKETSIPFEGHPDFFKIEVTNGSLNVIDMSIVSSCDEQTQADWDLNHGVVPSDYTEETYYFTYGLYPQTQVTDATLIQTLINTKNAMAEAGGFEVNQRIWYNDEYYVNKDGTENYFLVEPIVWQAVGKGRTEGRYYIDCKTVLDCHAFASEYATNYENSELRNWLTYKSNKPGSGTFMLSAFAFNYYYLKSFTPEETTGGDWVAVGSEKQYATGEDPWYSTNNERIKRVTDYAYANGATWYGDNHYGPYWTCTTFGTNYGNRIVDKDGKIQNHDSQSAFGVSPCFLYDTRLN